MAGQLLESKHSLLQARVEHLELDLGFKANGERRDKQRFVDVVRRLKGAERNRIMVGGVFRLKAVQYS